MVPAHIPIRDLLRLNMGMRFFLPILQANSDVGGPFRSPEKIKVIPESLMLIQRRYRSK